MDEVVFAMIAAIVGSVMVFFIITALFYLVGWTSIIAIKKLRKKWEKEDIE